MFKDGLKSFKKFNERFAKNSVVALSTIWAVYIFTIWSILPLVLPQYETFILYVSSGVLQLVLLPLIMLGTKIAEKSSEARANQDHKTILASFKELKEIMEHNHTIIAKLEEIEKRLPKN